MRKSVYNPATVHQLTIFLVIKSQLYHKVYTRIDYFITFGKDRSKIRDSDIGVIDLSDHVPIYITVNLENH